MYGRGSCWANVAQENTAVASTKVMDFMKGLLRLDPQGREVGSQANGRKVPARKHCGVPCRVLQDVRHRPCYAVPRQRRARRSLTAVTVFGWRRAYEWASLKAVGAHRHSSIVRTIVSLEATYRMRQPDHEDPKVLGMIGQGRD